MIRAYQHVKHPIISVDCQGRSVGVLDGDSFTLLRAFTRYEIEQAGVNAASEWVRDNIGDGVEAQVVYPHITGIKTT